MSDIHDLVSYTTRGFLDIFLEQLGFKINLSESVD